jgi:enamine deaminase RidA (YjgF/YER057c/UK114 family)
MASKPETRIQELHITLPAPAKPMAKYKTAVLAGNMLYVSDNTPMKGRVGADLSKEQGIDCARAVGINILATVKAAIGSLDKVKRLIKTLGMVNCTPDFGDHPAVVNGFSILMAEVFGDDAGVGARSAVGMGSLPGNIPVEIECIFEVAV